MRIKLLTASKDHVASWKKTAKSWTQITDAKFENFPSKGIDDGSNFELYSGHLSNRANASIYAELVHVDI